MLISKINGVDIVIANGNGFSAFNYITPSMKRPKKKIWKIRKGASIPQGLKLVRDLRPGHDGHYMIAPERNMPLKKYLGLLEELGMDRSRVRLITAMELQRV
ncbi:Tse2 family ADP-ribosyltransferase toxin [Sessilibacter sp. MAH4]